MKATWFSPSVAASAMTMAWWSALQRTKAMILVRSVSWKPNTPSKKRIVRPGSVLLRLTWDRRVGRVGSGGLGGRVSSP